MQNKLENVIWDQKELEERFQMVVKEHKMMELLVTELEEEHDMAIAIIEKLETKCHYVTYSWNDYVGKAEDPCMPLVVALFAVVGMSLKSVVQFFSTIKNKPVSDAVALLSFNWFIPGTLTYPSLPRVAHMLAPVRHYCYTLWAKP
ncbi:hypothetical protein TanjilG_27689 [Lupinus angustifolius]|uniref:Uncharacterized protein n=1 Tax=Lupinus angustifolius TaxID=3871 RepID=A0A4P1RHF0_LUPAN|nr:hypothetical protein TanjilG_27689 [Lupinus angustifolius]